MLNEAVIDVPDVLVERCMDILIKVVKRYISDIAVNYSLLSYYGDDKFSVDKKPSDNFRIIGSPFNEVTAYPIKYNHDIIKYSDEEGEATFDLGIIRLDRKSLGLYHPDYNAVLININSFINDLNDELGIVNDELDKTDSIDEMKEILDVFDVGYDVSLISRRFLKQCKSTIKHELGHMIQYQYLSKKSLKQVDTTGHYYDQAVEFSPTIIGAVEDMVTFYDSLPNDLRDSLGIDYRKALFAYLVGKSRLSPYVEDYVDQEVPGMGIINGLIRELITGNAHFFNHLKDNNPNQWKKAVKYTYSELVKRDILWR